MGADRVFVIAEAGVNHNGSLDRALAMVDAAAGSGADAVKFQTFKAERLVSRAARKADYQVANTGEGGSQLEMLRRLELSEAEHVAIRDRCCARGIEFMSTAFDQASMQFLVGLGMRAIKIPSGDLTAAPLVLAAARLRRPLIVSTGMATLQEIEQALGVIAFGLLGLQSPNEKKFVDAYRSTEGQAQLREFVTILHCVTEYPAPPGDVNLRALDVMREMFRLPVGYSDHTLGMAVALAAVARGASVLEKHFTLDRELPGPDHKASLVPDELVCLVSNVRIIEQALGRPVKAPMASEVKNIAAARRSIVASSRIGRGDLFTLENLAIKRPGDGMSPYRLWDLLGERSPRDYASDEVIEP